MMDELAIAGVLIVLLVVVITWSGTSVKVNDREVATYIPNVTDYIPNISIDTHACEVCARQCNWTVQP